MSYILSLDVSAACTGWCVTCEGINFITGTIETKPKNNRGERLVIFAKALTKVLCEYRPIHIVIEDTFAGKNTKTLKILSEFAGAAKYICQEVCGIDVAVVANTKVKAYFKARTKSTLFDFGCILFEEKDLTFKKDNDRMDSKLQLLYYLDIELDLYKYRFDKDYGFIYRGALDEENCEIKCHKN